ncbi:MAG TPA: hypothetical protein VGS21_04980, partial [Acidimicrobiales bacterium]|nr:hypothetical protein [Acidimicrobiales bacterium]
LTAADMASVEVTLPSGVSAIAAGDASQVIGKRAAEALMPGSLLSVQELSTGPVLPAGEALVGATLEPNQLPAELAAGSSVLVVLTNASGSTGAVPGTSGGSSVTAPSTGRSARQPSAVLLAQPPGSVLCQATVESVTLASATTSSAAPSSLGGVAVSLEVAGQDAPVVAAASAANEISLAVVPGSGNPGKPTAPGSGAR